MDLHALDGVGNRNVDVEELFDLRNYGRIRGKIGIGIRSDERRLWLRCRLLDEHDGEAGNL
jgi:hypothetical protein